MDRRYSQIDQLQGQGNNAFKLINDLQRRMSVNMNAKNVVNVYKMSQEYLCGLCQGILVDPMQCKKCKNNFHRACLALFCKETGKCPMNCVKPKFLPLKNEKMSKQVQELKFRCTNFSQGCRELISYEDAPDHDANCFYATVKCEAFVYCKAKQLRKDYDTHVKLCPFVEIQCTFCLAMMQRQRMKNHLDNYCDGFQECLTCQQRISLSEYQNNEHSCFKTLLMTLNKLVDDKNEASECIHVEVQKKNQQIRKIFESQQQSMGQLDNLIQVLEYDKSKQNKHLGQDPESRLKQNMLLLNRKEIFRINYNSDQLIVNPIDLKEEQLKFKNLIENLKYKTIDHMNFLNSEWNIYKNGIFVKEFENHCAFKYKLKINNSIDQIAESLIDPLQQEKFNINLKRIEIIQDFPNYTQLVHLESKGQYFIAPREYLYIQRVQKVSCYEIWVMSESIDDNFEIVQEKFGVRRGKIIREGWRLKHKYQNQSKCTYYSQCDLGISKALQKQMFYKVIEQIQNFKEYMANQN
ncbi:traf-type zinc finger family protein [Stylonychia lemnae]|uniref:Traf-type zinc finger family protein n=1 Tax=Stylonychia lemnae TaxID=5949 RepID=A0A078AYB6_STYLE|nr:traf-type zinc finger family protein [Stylonychia lemnae]|eukprot:CDW87126.1 traf-type zinc finger family protein [Stylonychia lemnae]